MDNKIQHRSGLHFDTNNFMIIIIKLRQNNISSDIFFFCIDCIWTAVEGSLTTFTDGFNVQKCAPGTRFDEVQCTCVISNIIPEGAGILLVSN